MSHERNNQSYRLFAYCNVMRRSPPVQLLGVHSAPLSGKSDEVTGGTLCLRP